VGAVRQNTCTIFFVLSAIQSLLIRESCAVAFKCPKAAAIRELAAMTGCDTSRNNGSTYPKLMPLPSSLLSQLAIAVEI
jgi:hypothetical protein